MIHSDKQPQKLQILLQSIEDLGKVLAKHAIFTNLQLYMNEVKEYFKNIIQIVLRGMRSFWKKKK